MGAARVIGVAGTPMALWVTFCLSFSLQKTVTPLSGTDVVNGPHFAILRESIFVNSEESPAWYNYIDNLLKMALMNGFENYMGQRDDRKYKETRSLEHDFGMAGTKPIEGGPKINENGEVVVDMPQNESEKPTDMEVGYDSLRAFSDLDRLESEIKSAEVKREMKLQELARDAELSEKDKELAMRLQDGEIARKKKEYEGALVTARTEIDTLLADPSIDKLDFNRSMLEGDLSKISEKLAALNPEHEQADVEDEGQMAA